MKPAFALGIVALCIGCANEPQEPEFYDPADVAGFYALHEVDGHAIGWYHSMAAVDCQVAFVTGRLELAPNANFILDLGYNFRCIGTNPVDGSSSMRIQGKIRYRENQAYVLGGIGPNLVEPERVFDNWTLEVTPNGEHVTLRFAGGYRSYFADPVITMGPRVAWEYPAP